VNRIGRDRRVAGHGGRCRVGGWEAWNPTNGRQDKNADSGRAYVFGCAGLFGHLRQRAAGTFGNFASNFNAPIAIHPKPSRRFRDRRACQGAAGSGRGASSMATAAPSVRSLSGRRNWGAKKAGLSAKPAPASSYEECSTFGRGAPPLCGGNCLGSSRSAGASLQRHDLRSRLPSLDGSGK
jgi:hypothetical protein